MSESKASSSIGQRLLNKVRQKIVSLNEAMHLVTTTEKNLKRNAQEVKSEIHKSIGQQLDTLRSREVWLLNQVELIQNAKEDVLRQQENELRESLGGLNSCLELDAAPDLSEYEGALSEKVADNLSRCNELELRPKETPYITYKAGAVGLRDAIHRFGKVDSKALSLDVVFVDPSVPSASLPQAFEEYDDDEHHVLYKTVAEINATRTNDTTIKLNLPKLSSQTDNWLLLPKEPVAVDDVIVDVSSPVRDRHNVTDTPAVSDSLHQWLRDIKNEVGVEEDDFEIISRTTGKTITSTSSDIDVLSEDGKAATDLEQSDPVWKYFSDANDVPFSYWLTESARIRSNYDLESSCPFETMPYFRDISNDTRDWLADSEIQQIEKRRCPDNCSGSSGGVTDIEDVATVECLQEAVTKYFREVVSEPERWLLPQSKPDDEKDVNQASIDRLCDTNEMSSSHPYISEVFGGEVLEPAPLQFPLQTGNIGQQAQWLLHSQTEAPKEIPMFDYFRMVSNEISDWLAEFSVQEIALNSADSICSIFSPFLETSPMSDWLLPGVKAFTDENPTLAYSPGFQNLQSDLSFWLTSKKDEQCEFFLTRPNFPSYHGNCGETTNWLLVTDNFEQTTESDWLGSESPGCEGKWLLREYSEQLPQNPECLVEDECNSEANVVRNSVNENTNENLEKDSTLLTQWVNRAEKSVSCDDASALWLYDPTSRSESVYESEAEFPCFHSNALNMGEWLIPAESV